MSNKLAEEYLSKLASIIQNEGTKDIFVIKKRLKVLNKPEDDVIIYECEKKRNMCEIYYGLLSDKSYIDVYKFKLGVIKTEKKISNVLHLKQWEIQFNSTVREKTFSYNDLVNDIKSWVLKYKNTHPNYVKQFLNTLNIYNKYTGQLIIAYYDFNNELHKIKPIIRWYEEVTIEELYDFAKIKSKILWNREFDCKIEIIKQYWSKRLGTYWPNKRCIHFSQYKNANYSKKEILDTLLHEMVHWHLHTTGKNNEDEDFEFIEECLRVGCGLSQDGAAQRAFRKYCEEKQIAI